MKSGYTMTIRSEKGHGISPAMHQHPRQSRISMAPNLCSVFGGIRRMSCTTSCFNLTKPLQGIGIDFNWCFWVEHWKKNKRNISKDTSNSPALQCSTLCCTDCQNLLGNAEMESPTPPAVLFWYCSFHHLFRSMAHGLAKQHFHFYEDAKKWVDSWIVSNDVSFFRRGIQMLPEKSNRQYFQ